LYKESTLLLRSPRLILQNFHFSKLLPLPCFSFIKTFFQLALFPSSYPPSFFLPLLATSPFLPNPSFLSVLISICFQFFFSLSLYNMCDFCPLCFSPSEEAVELDDCGHEFCKTCIELYLQDVVERRKSTTLRCPMGDCDELVNIQDEFRTWAKESTLKIYDSLVTQRITRLRCGICRSKLSDLTSKDGLNRILEGADVWLRCPSCSGVICSQCGASRFDLITNQLHDTDDCEYDSGSDADAENFNSRRIDDIDEISFLEEANMLSFGPHIVSSRRSSVSSTSSSEDLNNNEFSSDKPSLFKNLTSMEMTVAALMATMEQKQMVTRCPVCGHCVWREEGCAHIICVCEHEFCFYCRKSWDFRANEKQHWHRRRCPVRRHNDTYIQCRFPCDCDDLSDFVTR
jgi:hypothetical protein